KNKFIRMKKLIIIYIAGFFLLGSCKKELNQLDPNNVTEVEYWKTEADVLGGLAATYKIFRSPFRGYWGYKQVQLFSGRGDDFFMRNDDRNVYQLSTFTNNATTSTPSELYTGCYIGIFRANQVIEKTPLVEMDEERKAQLIAEAKFIRALNYFILVINFQSVPLITRLPQSSDDYSMPAAPEEAIWAAIESDWIEAKEKLPVSYPSNYVGRATKGAAIGFLAKAYVYQQKWAEAEQEFSLLVQSNGQPQSPYQYNLLDNYEHNFMKEYDNNIESLFEIQNQNVGGLDLSGTETAQETQGSTTAQAFAPTEVAGWFQAYPTNKMFNAFQKEKTIDGDFDPRMYASIVWDYPGATYYNKPYSSFTRVFDKNSRIRKYQNWRDDNEGEKVSEINEKVLRFADILLLYGETLTMLNRVNEAYPLINRIRARASLALLPTGYSQTSMMEEIRHQRMVEFFREGQRFYDLRRWSLLNQEIKNSDKEGREFYNNAIHQYFPIPQNEINTNPNIQQNPAWN
ncbi:MAG TPA: RagB/SusD family nutrient uptake outer membrane protein, partial [Pseudosphingobacterium sp.]|nr:RagB/SusD family nutrient uptake outer membrane protein [Pseudosphingobacterium sp.]